MFDVEGWTPPWPWVLDLLTRRSLVKVAPGIDHDLVPSGVEAEWVSDGGEVKEAVLWSPSLATTDRRATVIGEHGLATLTDEDSPADGEPATDVRPVGAYLYEPDGAVIRAGLVTAVAAGVGGGLVDPHIAYVTSDASFRTPFARGYRVVEQLPYREKPLRAALHERGIGRLTIKKRGVQSRPRGAPQAAGPARGPRGHPGPHPGLRAGDGPARRALLSGAPARRLGQQPGRATPGTSTGSRPGAGA